MTIRTFERTQLWYVYAFNGDMLFTGYAHHMNEPHVSTLEMNGWTVFRRPAKGRSHD